MNSRCRCDFRWPELRDSVQLWLKPVCWLMWTEEHRPPSPPPRPPGPPRSHTARHPGSGWASGCFVSPPLCRCGLWGLLPPRLLPAPLLPPGRLLGDWWGSGEAGAHPRVSGPSESADCGGAGDPCWPGGSYLPLRREEGGNEMGACWWRTDITAASLTVSVAGKAIDLVQPGVRFAHRVEFWISERALSRQSKYGRVSEMCRYLMLLILLRGNQYNYHLDYVTHVKFPYLFCNDLC